MQRADKASGGGRIKVEKNSNLVSWSVVYGKNDRGIDESYVAITFSSQTRAKTKRGNKQDSHTSAYALGLAQTMQIASRLTPKPEDNFRGINALVREISLFLKRDLFFFEEFNLLDSTDSAFIMAGPQKFEDTLKNQVLARKRTAEFDIRELDNVSVAVKGYQENQNSLIANTDAGTQILRNLGNIKPNRLYILEQNIRRGYVCDVVTIATGELLKYQNTAPYVTFPEAPTNDATEIKFRKAEGARVKAALKILASYSSSSSALEAIVDDLLDEEDESTLERNNLSTAAETVLAATIEEPKRSSARLASQTLISYNEKDLQKKYEEDAQQIKREEEAAKKEKNKTQIIANAIYNLLNYKPVENEGYDNATDRRTNNLNILCCVITKHLAMIFDTFEGLEEKDKIIDVFFDKMMIDWNTTIDAAPMEQKPKEEDNIEEVNSKGLFRGKKAKQKIQDDPKKKCEYLLKKKIKDTLLKWDGERERLKMQNENAPAVVAKAEEGNDFSINIGSLPLSEDTINVSLDPIPGEPNYIEEINFSTTTLQQSSTGTEIQSSGEDKTREKVLPMPISKLSDAGLSQLFRNMNGPSFKNLEDDSEGISLLKSNSIQQNEPPQTPVHSSSRPRGMFSLFSPLFSSSKKKEKKELSQAPSLGDHQSDNDAGASTDNAAGQSKKGRKKQ